MPITEVISSAKNTSQSDDKRSFLMFIPKGVEVRKDDMQSDDRTRSVQEFIPKEAEVTQHNMYFEGKTRSLQPFISKGAEAIEYHMPSEERTRSVQQFISREAEAIQDNMPSDDRTRSVQPFVSKEAKVMQHDMQSHDRTRSVQEFRPGEAEVTQHNILYDGKTRSVQPFISKETEVTPYSMQSEDRTRSIQEFKPMEADVKQIYSQLENRPRSILDFISKSRDAREVWTGGIISSTKEQQVSSLPRMSESGSLTPMLKTIDEISMDSFNHKFSIAIGHSTGVFTEMGNLRDHVVQFSSNEGWHSARSQLVDIAKSGSSSLIHTRCVFHHQDYYFICSERADACLADIIDCSFPMQEDVASAILSPIVHKLYHLMQKGIQYRGVKASNVYITAVKSEKNETTRYRVQLANFAPHLDPALVEASWSGNQDCIDVGWLGIHILTRRGKPKANSEVTGQTMKGKGPFTIDLKRITPSGNFMDFLDMCALGDIRKLLNHDFLRNTNSICLHPYIVNGGYHSIRHG